MGNRTPSIVPAGEDQSVYLVVDDFGDLGRCWRETDVEATDLETVITDMLDGQYNSPVRVIGFNTRGRLVPRRFSRCCCRIAPSLRSSVARSA
jgi:hypothetical protein